MWTGLALAGAGAAVFATAGRTVNVPQQCALVPLGSFCLPAKSYRDYRQGQQLTGAAMVAAGGDNGLMYSEQGRREFEECHDPRDHQFAPSPFW